MNGPSVTRSAEAWLMMGRGMSAVQEAIRQQERGLRRRPCCWPLLTMPTSLIVYVVAVLACDLALTGWKLAGTPLRAGDLLLLVALPPVILLQRSLMHQQLAAAARTDPKTGLLNATAWQRAVDVALYKAKDAGRDQVRLYAHAPGQVAAPPAQATAREEWDEATDGYP